MRRYLAVTAALILLCLTPVHAGEAVPLTDDPVTEERVHKLGEELRCLVCQNQNIADSHADLAMDLKKELREQVSAGRSDREILDFMVERYGDFVLYRPPFKAITVLLWVGPFALLLITVFALARRLRHRAVLAARANTLNADDQARARALLADEENKV
jgi:cytochrome c-type biogenesis protein CcmH